MADHDSPWQPDDELSAKRLNRMAEDSRAARGVPSGTGGDGFAFSGGTGYAPRPPQEFWAKLTGGGTSGEYAWTEQVPDDGGTWVDGGRSGTVADDPAVESGGNASLATDGSVIVFLRKLPGSRRRTFQKGMCP